MPEGCLELKDIFCQLMYEPLLTKFARQLTTGRQALDAEKVTSNFDRVSAVSNLLHVNIDIVIS